MVEHGRSQNIPREERICQLCSSNVIKNEEHLLNSCNKYDHIRDNFISSLDTQNQQLNTIPDLLKSTFKKLSKFVASCFSLRDKHLETANAASNITTSR
jgi:hypothetical protein